MIPQEGVLRFSDPQRSLIFKALSEAEERIAGYYCIPPFRWEQLRYDLLTQADHEWESFPESMLARVRCLQRANAGKSFDFYRIELHDRSILAAAERERWIHNIYPFFVYILTHEMVHMVRLSSILENSSVAPIPLDQSEESKVQGISRKILVESNFQEIGDRLHCPRDQAEP
jgi:hypothetical protein